MKEDSPTLSALQELRAHHGDQIATCGGHVRPVADGRVRPGREGDVLQAVHVELLDMDRKVPLGAHLPAQFVDRLSKMRALLLATLDCPWP